MSEQEKTTQNKTGEMNIRYPDDDHEKPQRSGTKEDEMKIITSSGHRHHNHRSKKGKHHVKKKLKKSLLIVGIVLLSLVLIALSAVAVMYHTGKNELNSDKVRINTPPSVDSVEDGQYVYYKGDKYRYKSDVINMLFLGIDENNYIMPKGDIGSNGSADMIALAAIDKKDSKVTIINIPRDIMTDVKAFSLSGGYSGMEKMQIGLSYAYGNGADTSCVNAMSAVRSLFYNVPVNSYFSLQMEGVPDLNDSIGGVDVVSPATIGPFVKGEKYHLDGSDALLFVHKRDMQRSDASLKRNDRQKVYLKSFISKFIKKTKKDIGVPISVYNATKPYSCTNLNASRIIYLATEYILNRNMKIKMESVPVTVSVNENRNAENYVKEEEFYEMFLSVFYEKVSK